MPVRRVGAFPQYRTWAPVAPRIHRVRLSWRRRVWNDRTPRRFCEEGTVTAYPTWTPAPRPGIIPLHPLGFGTILGRSFAALRQNPRVLLGFALVVQTLAALLLAGAIA